jgi:hypothetical protein
MWTTGVPVDLSLTVVVVKLVGVEGMHSHSAGLGKTGQSRSTGVVVGAVPSLRTKTIVALGSVM